MTSVSLNYVICTAPRTGSTLLSEALSSTNRAGKPNEFFDIYDHNEQFWKRKLGIEGQVDYFDRTVAAATTSNGVYGVKLLWHQMPAMLAKLKASVPVETEPSADEPSLHRLLSDKLGNPRYIWLRRQNKLAQAISYYRASRTGLWRSVDVRSGPRDVADRELPFDADAIAAYLKVVNDFDLAWHAYFQRHRVKVLMIVYENFVKAYEPTVGQVLDFLDIDRTGAIVAPPRLERQSDPRSEEWEQRFLALRRDTPPASDATPAQHAVAAGAEAEPVAAPAGAVARPSPKPRPDRDDSRPLPLIAYSLTAQKPALVKAKPHREWMDASPRRFAYRCLPMVIANQAGWMILNRHKIAVTWNGGVETTNLKIDFLSGDNPRSAVSLFGSGILTFMIGYLFRTPPGYNLLVQGPANSPKDGISALQGIVESDWAESTFTMNWKLTRPNHPVVFEEDEPIAMITPTPRHMIERFQPEIRDLATEPELASLHKEWAASRHSHNAGLRVPNSEAQKEGWQRHYMRGTSIRKEPAPDHQMGLVLKDFVDRTGAR